MASILLFLAFMAADDTEIPKIEGSIQDYRRCGLGVVVLRDTDYHPKMARWAIADAELEIVETAIKGEVFIARWIVDDPTDDEIRASLAILFRSKSVALAEPNWPGPQAAPKFAGATNGSR
jgi:hypothetical protein